MDMADCGLSSDQIPEFSVNQKQKDERLMMKRIVTATMMITLFAILTQNAHASGHLGVPDAASTSMLLVFAFGALATIRRFLR
jgi:hypothetical protein